jgi:hypothetical protein
MSIWTARSGPIGPILIGAGAVLALLLALPGQTVATKYLGDLFIMLDSAYRVSLGQVPNRDFHTALGPLSSYLPAAGYGLSGTLGGAMPTAMALIMVALVLPMAHIFSSRLQPIIALPFGIFLLLILAAPVNLGEGVTALSFAKFYNRIGWVALGTLLVMYLRPDEPRSRQGLLDMLCAAFLTGVMLYTKLTYGVVAIAFLALMLFDAAQRRWVLGSLGLILAVGLIVEAFWRSTLPYLDDLRIALEVGGRLRGTWGQITDHVLVNLTDYVMLGIFAFIALRRTRSVRDALFYVLCAVAGFLIINQNFQAWGIITIHAAAAVAAETILRSQNQASFDAIEQRWSVSAGAKLLFLALVLPTIVHGATALSLHTASAGIGAGQALALPNLNRVRLANLWTWHDHNAATAYVTTIQDGIEALTALEAKPQGVFVLDLANPFSMILGSPPPRGDTPWLQWGRTLNGSVFIPAETLLANVQVVMEPKIGNGNPDAPGGAEQVPTLQSLYAPYLAAKFSIVRETDHWKIHQRSQPDAPQARLNEAERP